jgi:hypothetical protein
VIRPHPAAVLLSFAAATSGLTAQGAMPPAGLVPLEAVPRYAAAAPAIAPVLEEAPRKDRPYRFAVAVPLGLSLAAGQWELADAATAVWRLRVTIPGARSLSLRLFPLVLPQGGSVRLYDPALQEGTDRPYTPADARRRGAWTPMVHGDEVVVEARVPAGTESQLQLGIADAYYGYRDWRKAAVPPKNGGDAGSCNVNVACPAGSAWTTEARSVALITIANQYVCSGQLLNNVRQDRAPLFITADHCGIGTADTDVGDASSVNFYFAYQAAACGAPPAPRPPVADVQGATFLADDVQADFTLLRLNLTGSNHLPPDVYFAGWSAMGQGSASGAALHHPSGDEKKISVYSTALSQAAADIGAACPIDSWQVQWSAGTTEPGSSGGGLWNAAHRLIGVLSGGNASCQNIGGADYFARLDRAWTANPNRDGQLKVHLDPDSTCIAEINGLDPQANPSAAPVSTGPTRCEGQSSACGRSGGGGGGGAMMPWLVLGLLAARAAKRRR